MRYKPLIIILAIMAGSFFSCHSDSKPINARMMYVFLYTLKWKSCKAKKILAVDLLL